LGRAGTHGGGTPELPRLLGLGGELLLLLRSELLLLLRGELLGCKLLGLLSKLLGSELLGCLLKMRGQGVDLSVLIFIPGESSQGDVLQCELGGWDLGRSLGLLLELLLGSKLLLLGSKLLLSLRSELLLLLRSELLLLLRGKLLLLLELLELGLEGWPLLLLGSELLLGSKLLLLLRGKLLLLLLLLELLEVLVEVLSVELLRSGLVGVELSSVEHGSPLLSTLVGELPSLQGVLLLLHDPLLLRDDALLMCEHGIVTLLLQCKLGAGCDGLQGGGRAGHGAGLQAVSVRGEAGGVVSGVFHDDQLTGVIQVTVFAFYIAFLVSGLQLEGAVGGLIADGVGSVLVDLIDLFENDSGMVGGDSGD